MKHRNAVNFVGASAVVAGIAVASFVLVACGGSTTGGGGGSGATSATGATTGGMSTGTGSTGGSFVKDGFVSAGPWTGYAFTVIDTLMPPAVMTPTTVTPFCPVDGSGCMPAFVGTKLNMKGNVAANADYNGFAMLGWSVAQDPSTDPDAGPSPLNTWKVPAAGGVTITFDNPMAAPTVRLQLQMKGAADGAAGNDQRFCIELESGVQVKWSDFKSQCWGTMGIAMAPGTEIVNAAVQIPGSNTADIPFDITINNIVVE